ncbi:MAG TPA: hypothetical protein VGG25_29350 [Streptosporangiaceae bacterium]|jgi:hypothetical protein
MSRGGAGAETGFPDDDGTSPDLMNVLRREFPAWQFDIHPEGLRVWTALWRSEDGRHERYIVARTDSELLARLRAVDQP